MELATQMGEMGWREAGESVGRAGRMEWMAGTRGGVEPERPPHVEGAEEVLPLPLPIGVEGGVDRKWSGVGVGLEGVGLEGIGAGNEEGKEEEGNYRVSLPLEE